MNEGIYKKIKDKILFLELPPGEVIDERSIAAEFKVSRTPIREVLHRLEWEGFVEIVPRGVVSVSTLEYTKIQNTFFMRVQLEGLAGKLAAAYGYPKHIAEIKAILESLKGKRDNLEIRQLVEFDATFREVLYEATGNAVLKQISDNLYEQTLRVWLSHVQNDQTGSVLPEDIDLLIEEMDVAILTIEQKQPEAGESKRRDIFVRQIKRTTEQFIREIETF